MGGKSRPDLKGIDVFKIGNPFCCLGIKMQCVYFCKKARPHARTHTYIDICVELCCSVLNFRFSCFLNSLATLFCVDS